MAGLAEKEITASRPRMGRPPIGKFTAVRLPPDMLARIDAIAGPGKRAAFIREAVEKELTRLDTRPPPPRADPGKTRRSG